MMNRAGVLKPSSNVGGITARTRPEVLQSWNGKTAHTDLDGNLFSSIWSQLSLINTCFLGQTPSAENGHLLGGVVHEAGKKHSQIP